MHSNPQTATLVFDGECVFCNACVRWMNKHIRNTPRVVAWQETDVQALGLTEAQCSEAVQWVSADGKTHRSGHLAVAQLACDSGEWWRFVGYLIPLPVISQLGAMVYKKIANSRRCAVRSTG
jgi:predicted DCC family thiol-disulfide oxidoreductase YuxK